MSKLKYEYGVEYETNGEKPDLPDDVLVCVMFDGGWAGPYIVDNWIWDESRKFYIVDERYRPKPNDWHKRGELPPVGEVVEYSCLHRDGKEFIELGQWYSGKIIAYHDGFVWTSDNGLRMINNTKFRPLRTERDVLVEKAADAMRGTEVNLTGSHLQVLSRQLIDANWRPIKQQTEDEFADYAVRNWLGILSTHEWRDLYRAGCRFVEVDGD